MMALEGVVKFLKQRSANWKRHLLLAPTKYQLSLSQELKSLNMGITA